MEKKFKKWLQNTSLKRIKTIEFSSFKRSAARFRYGSCNMFAFYTHSLMMMFLFETFIIMCN
jgi:hypothetical protein